MSNELISIVVPTFNRSYSIRSCIDSILNQTHSNFELLISDDCSVDDTREIVQSYTDNRIILLQTKKNGGPSAARNRAILKAHGDIIFFTDDDVVVDSHWIEKALPIFKDQAILGVEGRIIYVSEGYKPAYGDRVVENKDSGSYMTANMAYRKNILTEVGMFDLVFKHYQDREMALRILKHGKIVYLADMVVNHQRERYTTRSYFSEAEKINYWVKLMKESGDRKRVVGIVCSPEKLISLAIPFIGIIKLFTSRFEDKNDWLLLLLLYPRLWYERILLWRAAIKERIFLL